ncbi:MAG TPA: hypothetical protein VIR78_14365 [Malonomonas sp.]
MSGKNLWGAMPDIANIRTPHTIMLEQGAYLAEVTEGLLELEIKRLLNKTLFIYECSIVVPSVQYRQVILRITHDIKLYPSILRNEQSGEEFTAKNQSEFEEDLGAILSSEDTRLIIVGLLSQAKLQVELEQ